MKRRDFFGKTGCGVAGLMLAHFGFASCQKKEETVEAKAPVQETPKKELNVAIQRMKEVNNEL